MNNESADLSALRIGRDKKEERPPAGSRRGIILMVSLLILLVAGYVVVRAILSPVMEVELATATLTYPSQANTVLTASGYVVAQQKAAVASKGTGRLEFLGVEEGDRVRKGDVIARLEDSDVLAALVKAEADLQVAKADSADATQVLERQRRLFDSQLSSRAELTAAEARFDRTRALIRSAIAGVTSAQVGVENTRIRAPFDGTVLTKNADVGEVVAPFASAASSRGAVVTIADMSSLEVEADVSEANITRVRIHQPCEVVLDAYPDKRYQAFVHKIVPTADRAKATVMTKVRFKNKDERVLPEMSAKVLFLTEETAGDDTTPPKLTVPSSAIRSHDGGTFVLRVQDQAAFEVPVKTGVLAGSRIEILQGLNQGDQVINNPVQAISNGTKVRVKGAP